MNKDASVSSLEKFFLETAEALGVWFLKKCFGRLGRGGPLLIKKNYRKNIF